MTSYPKRAQSTRPKRRKFHGNQYIYDTEEDKNADVSASSRKSNTSGDDITVSPLHYYRIIEFLTVFGVLSDILYMLQIMQTESKF